MNVVCQANKASEIGSFRRGLYFEPNATFDLIVGQIYRVYAIALFREVDLAASIDPKPRWYPAQAGLIVLTSRAGISPPVPAWYPIEFFSIDDAELPGHWLFRSSMAFGVERLLQTGVEAIWGYPELVDSPDHMLGLLDRDPKALAVFRSEVARQPSDDP